LEAAPLVREVVAAAYRAGAPLVEVVWGDEPSLLTRFATAPPESFGQCSSWLPTALTEHVDAGHAVLTIYANDPNLLNDQPADRGSRHDAAQSRRRRHGARIEAAQLRRHSDRRVHGYFSKRARRRSLRRARRSSPAPAHRDRRRGGPSWRDCARDRQLAGRAM